MSALFAQTVLDGGEISTQAQIVAVVITVLLLGLVLELVRRRRLIERYALLWIVAVVALVILAVWRGGLEVLKDVVGTEDPVNALFLIAFAVLFALALHFSVAFSRLSEEAKILAQEVARLDAELRALRQGAQRGNGAEPEDRSEQREHGSPVGGEQPRQ